MSDNRRVQGTHAYASVKAHRRSLRIEKRPSVPSSTPELCTRVQLIGLARHSHGERWRARVAASRLNLLQDARLLDDRDPTARALFEATALSACARLNVERRQILADVRERGTVYGKTAVKLSMARSGV